MSDGYRRLNSSEMKQRDDMIVQLTVRGLAHKIIAIQVRMQPSGLEARLRRLREAGKLTRGDRDGEQASV